MDNLPLFNSWKRYHVAQLILLALYFFVYLYLRIQFRGNLAFLGDELFMSANMKQDLYTYLTKALPSVEYHLPGSFLLAYPIAHWVSTDRFILFLPYLTLAAILYWMLAFIDWWKVLGLKEEKGNWTQWTNVVACFLLTHNVHNQLHSVECRPYSTLSLLSLSAFVLVWRLMYAQRFRWRYVAGVAAISLFHNFGILMISLAVSYVAFRQFVVCRTGDWRSRVLSVWKRSRVLSRSILFGFVIALPCVWYYCSHAPMFVNTSSAKGAASSFGRNTHEYIRPGWEGAEQVFSIYYGLAAKMKKIRKYFVICFFVATVLFLRRKEWACVTFPLVFVIAPTLLIYVFALRSNYWFLQRQFVWVMPYWAVYNAVCLMTCVRFISQGGTYFTKSFSEAK